MCIRDDDGGTSSVWPLTQSGSTLSLGGPVA